MSSSQNAFPTFSYYWKSLIQPSRRTVPIRGQPAATEGAVKRSGAAQASIEGILSVSSTGSYAIEDKDFAIDAHTWVFGDLKAGAKAKVVFVSENSRRRAIKITIVA